MARLTTYVPYGNAYQAYLDKSDEVILHGGVNTGKTLCNFQRAHAFAQKYAGARILFCRKALADLMRTAVATYEDVILPCPLYDPSCPVQLKMNKEGSIWYEYKENYSKIFLGGMNKWGSWLSGEYDMVVTVQTEEFEEEDWEHFLTRIGRGAGNNGPYAMLLGDANPHILGNMHWIMQRKTVKLYKLYREHNPALKDQVTGEDTQLGVDTERRLERLTGTTRKRLRDGEWVGSDRLVYPEFQENMHIIDSHDFITFQDGTQERIEYEKWYLGMDWGSTEPASLSLYGLTYTTENFRKPRLIQVRQTYRTSELTSFWKRRALAYQRWARWHYGGYIQKMLCDKSRPEHIEEFRIAGLPAVKTDGGAGSVRENINAVKVRLDEQSLFFVRDNLDDRDEILEAAHDCLCTTDEIIRYENPKINPFMKKVPDPVGANHGLDELGYVARDIHVPQDNRAEIDTFTGEDVLNTKLQLPGSKIIPSRWKQQMGIAS